MESYIVVGGGLAGLTAANALAGPGRRVTLLEQSDHLGGRAHTQQNRGYCLNMGPHALYRGGHAFRTLTDWKIPFSGKVPDQSRDAFLVRGDRKFPVITSPGSLLLSRMFSLTEKYQAVRVLSSIRNSRVPQGWTVDQWLGQSAPNVREFFSAIVRVTTYSDDLAHLDARATAAQIAIALNEGVLYLDGGWETLVRGLEQRARSMGVEIRCGELVVNLQSLDASGIVLAVPPQSIERITGRTLTKLRPIKAAVLDVGLKTMPEHAARFGLGLDQPLYFSVHSHSATLAPDGAALVHVAKYGGGDRDQFERFADLLMPGWQAHSELVRYLPNATVSYAVPATEGRPDVDALDMDGVTIAGDWVGPEGMLSDSAVASALRAASMVKRQRRAA